MVETPDGGFDLILTDENGDTIVSEHFSPNGDGSFSSEGGGHAPADPEDGTPVTGPDSSGEVGGGWVEDDPENPTDDNPTGEDDPETPTDDDDDDDDDEGDEDKDKDKDKE